MLLILSYLSWVGFCASIGKPKRWSCLAFVLAESHMTPQVGHSKKACIFRTNFEAHVSASFELKIVGDSGRCAHLLLNPQPLHQECLSRNWTQDGAISWTFAKALRVRLWTLANLFMLFLCAVWSLRKFASESNSKTFKDLTPAWKDKLNQLYVWLQMWLSDIHIVPSRVNYACTSVLHQQFSMYFDICLNWGENNWAGKENHKQAQFWWRAANRHLVMCVVITFDMRIMKISFGTSHEENLLLHSKKKGVIDQHIGNLHNGNLCGENLMILSARDGRMLRPICHSLDAQHLAELSINWKQLCQDTWGGKLACLLKLCFVIHASWVCLLTQI